MSTLQSDKAARFAALHDRPGAFVIPNPWDIGTARMLAGLGFEALATTSAGFAFSLGRRDGALTRDEALAHCRSIVDATPLPVSADLENGYDHRPEGCAETIRHAAAAGLVGASIEDATGDRDSPIYDAGEATERIHAAVEAARQLPFRFTLTARAENFLHGRPDLDDTIARLQAFEAAGADVLYAPGLRTLAAIDALCDAVLEAGQRRDGSRWRDAVGRSARRGRSHADQPRLGALAGRTRRFAPGGAGDQGTGHLQLCRRGPRLRRPLPVPPNAITIAVPDFALADVKWPRPFGQSGGSATGDGAGGGRGRPGSGFSCPLCRPPQACGSSGCLGRCRGHWAGPCR